MATANVATVESPPPTPPTRKRLVWEGGVSAQEWTNLYARVLRRSASPGDGSIRVRIEAMPQDGVTDQQVADARAALSGTMYAQ